MGWAESIGALITVICTGACSVILAMTKWQADKVKDRDIKIGELESRIDTLEEQQVKDRSLFRDAIRHIRAHVAHGLELAGLLHAHAPDVPVPTAPPMPESIRDEV